MAFIELNNPHPGIRGLLNYSPESAYPLLLLANTLLQNETATLRKGEREIIATYVSGKNECTFCQLSHGAAAAHHLHIALDEIENIKKNPELSVVISEKLKALLQIAGKVQQGGTFVTQQDIDNARNKLATDQDIHDTVLIAAAFCMYNRYVDGLGTWAEEDPASYIEASIRMAEQGYLRKDNLKLMGKISDQL